MTNKAVNIKYSGKLRASTRQWVARVTARLVLDEQDEMVLALAATAWDFADKAGKDIEKNGLHVVDNRLGTVRPNPSVKIQHDSIQLFAKLIKQLDLKVEPPEEPKKHRRSF